jgi:hypothetical protein
MAERASSFAASRGALGLPTASIAATERQRAAGFAEYNLRASMQALKVSAFEGEYSGRRTKFRRTEYAVKFFKVPRTPRTLAARQRRSSSIGH